MTRRRQRPAVHSRSTSGTTATMDATTARKTDAEIAKLIAETSKINAEARWYPFVVTAGVFAAALALLRFLA